MGKVSSNEILLLRYAVNDDTDKECSVLYRQAPTYLQLSIVATSHMPTWELMYNNCWLAIWLWIRLQTKHVINNIVPLRHSFMVSEYFLEEECLLPFRSNILRRNSSLWVIVNKRRRGGRGWWIVLSQCYYGLVVWTLRSSQGVCGNSIIDARNNNKCLALLFIRTLHDHHKFTRNRGTYRAAGDDLTLEEGNNNNRWWWLYGRDPAITL